MMMVETELRASPIQGIGIFLMEDVAKGSLLWRFDSRVDRVYSPEELASLPEHMQAFIRRFSTWHEKTGLWILCGDNGRHFNHSDTPNTFSRGIGFGDDLAAEDLRAGTELTCDYRAICDAMRVNGLDFEAPQLSPSRPRVSSFA
jgi:uncharacterized protein